MDPVLDLPLNEGSGTTVYDRSGWNNHGTIYGASWQKIWRDWVLYFDGVDDYVRVNNVPNGLSVTVLVWAKSNTAQWNTWGWIASSRVANGFIIHPNAATKSWSGYIFDSGGTYHYIGTHTPTDITVWHQYGIVYDYDLKKAYMYFDGDMVVSVDMNISRTTGTINVEFGRDYQWPSRYGNGFIGEVRTFRKALTDDQIRVLSNLFRGELRKPPSL